MKRDDAVLVAVNQPDRGQIQSGVAGGTGNGLSLGRGSGLHTLLYAVAINPKS
jgi:hypothetical protein